MDLIPVEEMLLMPATHHYGCACRSMDILMQWFTEAERVKLAEFGYYPVRMVVDQILAESDKQVVFARERHLRDGATRLSWPER